jgi:hypothetical protein
MITILSPKNLKLISNLTFVILFGEVIFGIYGLFKDGIIARQLIIYWPIFTNGELHIYFAPYSIDVALWGGFFLIFYWKGFKYLTIPLLMISFGIDEFFFQISYYTDTLHHLFFNDFLPLALLFVLIGFVTLKGKLTWKNEYSKYFMFLGYPTFILLWTAMGNPIILNPILHTETIKNWIWELWYQIFYLTLVFEIVNLSPKGQTTTETIPIQRYQIWRSWINRLLHKYWNTIWIN